MGKCKYFKIYILLNVETYKNISYYYFSHNINNKLITRFVYEIYKKSTCVIVNYVVMI